jgi:hypothetical protein
VKRRKWGRITSKRNWIILTYVLPSDMALGPTPILVHFWLSSNTVWPRFVTVVASDGNATKTAARTAIFHMFGDFQLFVLSKIVMDQLLSNRQTAAVSIRVFPFPHFEMAQGYNPVATDKEI